MTIEDIYDQYAPALLGLICQKTLDRREAEEMLVDIFMEANDSEVLKAERIFCRLIDIAQSHLKRAGYSPVEIHENLHSAGMKTYSQVQANNSFGKPIIPADDEERIASLRSYDILNPEPDHRLDQLTLTVAKTFNTSIALISLVDEDRVFFKSNFGLEGKKYVDRGFSLCSLVILQDHPTIFEDALKEPCLLANPLVAGEFGLRFYAGAPLITSNGFNIGAVCLVDKEPRNFSSEQQELLVDFSRKIMREIEERNSR